MLSLRTVSQAVALSAVAAVLVAAPLPSPAPTSTATAMTADPTLLTDTALIMGGTGMPDPPQWYLDKFDELYIQPNFPGYDPVALHTPAQAFPFFGFMSGDQSIAQGVYDLHRAITHTYAGDNLLIFGVSQSALIASIEMHKLADAPPDGLGELHFALLAGPTNPMGGIIERFPGLNWPFLDLARYPSTPTDAFPTDVYAGQYDGVSDFPRYPLNFVSTLNALMGMSSVHLGYGNVTAEEFASAVHLGHTGLTDFYMIPTPILPLLQPMYDSGDFGLKVLADYLQPQLKVLVDLGYGNLQHGLVPDPGSLDGAASAAVGILPKVDPLAVMAALQLGQVHGIVNATNDVLANEGLPALPGYMTDILKAATGYDVTHGLDQAMLSGLTQLSTLPGMADLNPDVLFDGSPLIDGAPIIDALNKSIDDVIGWIAGLL